MPWDRLLGLGATALTPAASEVASIAGVQTSFAQAAEVTLQKLCGLRLSESTVERVAEAAGKRLDELLQTKTTFGQNQPWRWQRDACGRRCAYVGLDATGVRQQGLYPDDESKRREHVAAWCHQLKHAGGATLLATLEALEVSGCPPSARQAHVECVRYFRNHHHRMDCPRYLANG